MVGVWGWVSVAGIDEVSDIDMEGILETVVVGV